MMKTLAVVFFAINALFWGLFPHATHCQVASLFTNQCLPHVTHISIGVMCFLIAVAIAQQKWLALMFA